MNETRTKLPAYGGACCTLGQQKYWVVFDEKHGYLSVDAIHDDDRDGYITEDGFFSQTDGICRLAMDACGHDTGLCCDDCQKILEYLDSAGALESLT